MSADNWAICPRCAARDPFMGSDDAAHTLREDYEIGIDRDGVFTVSYSARCGTCGLSHRFSRVDTVHATPAAAPREGEQL